MLEEAFDAELSRLRDAAGTLDKLRDAAESEAAGNTDAFHFRHVEIVEVDAAAGGGAEADSETVAGRLAFRAEWLREQGLEAAQCRIIRVAGESMEPTLPAGCSILIDMKKKHLHSGRIFVVRGEDGLLVKRAVWVDGRWILESDHPAWEPIPPPRGAEVLGEVCWMARTF